jgi:AcrR family transcriptional regulator
MRADAQRSRRLLLDTACGLFVEVGIGVALEAVARRAGVGIATLYRHFPNRLARAGDCLTPVSVRSPVRAWA